MKLALSVILSAFILAGCASEYHMQPLSGSQHEIVLNPKGSVFIAVPKDGKYQDINYPGSGQFVAEALSAQFSKYASTVQTAASYSANNDFSEADRANGEYLVVPVITHWEQRATEWSGLPSRMSLRITIFDVSTRKQLISEGIEGRTSKMTLTATRPEHLLKKPLSEFVRSLYRGKK